MEEQQPHKFADAEIDLRKCLAILRPAWWKIVLVTIGAGIFSLVVTFQMRDLFQSTAVLAPTAEEGKQVPTLGVLASIGVVTGGPTKVEDLETIFKSNDLTVRVFKKYSLWGIVFPDRFDSTTGKLRVPWMDRLFGNKDTLVTPGEWDAIRAVKNCLTVTVNKRAGTVSLSFESPSPEGSARIVNYYLEEGKSRLQEEAFDRANKNKRFIEEQIAKTVDALNRDRLYSLYGQEVEREMLARNREQFAFRVIDSPRIADRKFKPRRGLTAILVMILSLPILISATILLRKKEMR